MPAVTLDADLYEPESLLSGCQATNEDWEARAEVDRKLARHLLKHDTGVCASFVALDALA